MKTAQLLIAFFVLSLSAFAQTNIQFILKNGYSYKIEKLFSSDLSQKEIHEYKFKDTINISFGKKIIDCYNISFYIGDKFYHNQLWLDTGNIRIEAYIDSSKLVIDTVINSPFYYYVKNYNEEISPIWKTKDTLQLNNFMLVKAQKNLDNPFSLSIGQQYLFVNQNIRTNVKNLKDLFAVQGEKFAWHLLYPNSIGRANKILESENYNVLDYKFIDKSKKTVALNLKDAEYYVLDFWFLECAPCLREHKLIDSKLDKLKENSVEVIGISRDKYSKKWKKYLAKNHYTWSNYLLPAEKKLNDDLSIEAYPYYLLVNKSGTIIGSYKSITQLYKRFGIED